MKLEITHNRGGYRYCNEDEKNEWDKLDSFDSLVCDAPTVDAVPVVRCKDCENCYPVRLRNGEIYFYECDFHDIEVEPDDFCSYGERRTNERKAD